MSNELLDSDKLIDWLRTQPSDGEYVWSDPVFCLMGRYLADHDSMWGKFAYSEMPNYYEIAQEKPWTYGAALQRAEALRLPGARKMLPPPAPQLTHPSAERLQNAIGG